MPPKGSIRQNIIGPLKDFFEAHLDEVIKIHRLITATGFDDDQIRSALNNARKQGYPLEVVTRGQAWTYRDPAKKAMFDLPIAVPVDPDAVGSAPVGSDEDSKGFYQLNVDKDGNPILQRDCDGTIWVARRI